MTIGDGTTATVTLTNTYIREFGSLAVAKVVSGDGYIGGTGQNFTIGYDCGSAFTGTVTVAAGGSVTIPGLPARVTCEVKEVPPAAGLLDPAHVWGTPTWSPGAEAVVPANGTTTLTVTNPTTPIFGQVRVTKAVTGATGGVTAGATFHIVVDCGAAGCSRSTSAPATPVRPLTSPSGRTARSRRILRPAAWSTGRTRGRSRRPRPRP